MMIAPFVVPHESDLREFFGAEPVECSVEDGYWCYEVVDERDAALRFSFKLFERSVQATLSVAQRPLVTVAQEGAEFMGLSGRTLTCRFACPGGRGTLVLRIDREIYLDWSTLMT
jgi:hypothetical protein